MSKKFTSFMFGPLPGASFALELSPYPNDKYAKTTQNSTVWMPPSREKKPLVLNAQWKFFIKTISAGLDSIAF
jgi:hypothetical protein